MTIDHGEQDSFATTFFRFYLDSMDISLVHMFARISDRRTQDR